MIDDKLEILIITYNRAKYLDRTFAQLLEGPFSRCKITVLDNCSSDETPLVCAKYQSVFPDFNIIRHRKNIGACANYLRAVELSESLYTWILCDDDTFDFTDCLDVVEAIQRGSVDLIHTGAPGEVGWERESTTTSANLTKNGTHYFWVLSFVPSLIFKTERFDSECIAKGYRISANSYPHFEFLKQSVRDNSSIYVSKREIVDRGRDDSYLSGLTWFTLWVNNCRTIEDGKLRRAAVYELGDTARKRSRWLKTLPSGSSRRRLMRLKGLFVRSASYCWDLAPTNYFCSPSFLPWHSSLRRSIGYLGGSNVRCVVNRTPGPSNLPIFSGFELGAVVKQPVVRAKSNGGTLQTPVS